MTLIQTWALLIALTVGYWLTGYGMFLIFLSLTVGAWIGYSHGYYDGWGKREKPRMPLQKIHRTPAIDRHLKGEERVTPSEEG